MMLLRMRNNNRLPHPLFFRKCWKERDFKSNDLQVLILKGLETQFLQVFIPIVHRVLHCEAFLSAVGRRLDAVNVNSIHNNNQFQIVRRKDFPFRVVYSHSEGFSGSFVQNLKAFLAPGEEMTLTPLAQSDDDREQLSAFWG